MPFFRHILVICSFVLLLTGCDRSNVYEEKSKTLDSLNVAIHVMANELAKTDTVMLKKVVSRFIWYKQFIQQNINDTINKAEADQLQHFYASGKALQNFSDNRKLILERAELMNLQVQKLVTDVKSRSIDKAQVIKFGEYERNQAAKLIESGYDQQKLYHTGMEEFTTSLRAVEALIRSRNNGELPTIIKDTIQL